MKFILTLNPPTWRIWWAPNNASRWYMGFNSAFKELKGVLIFLMFWNFFSFVRDGRLWSDSLGHNSAVHVVRRFVIVYLQNAISRALLYAGMVVSSLSLFTQLGSTYLQFFLITCELNSPPSKRNNETFLTVAKLYLFSRQVSPLTRAASSF